MIPGQIIFEGKTKIGQIFILRYPKEGDLEKLLNLINEISLEKTFIRIQGIQLTLEQEKTYLDNQLKKIREGKAVQLCALINNQIVELGCFANNEVALNLYKELGFKEFGRLPNGIRYRDQFVDHIYLYKKIR